MNLMIQDLAGNNVDLKQFVEISENQIKTMITDAYIISSDRIKKNGVEYQKLIYTGVQGVYSLKFEQYYWVKDGKAYILTLTCEEDEYDNYKVVGEKMMNSFKIK